LKKADLHIHTSFSDGTFSPQEVIAQAKKHRIDCVAICDHDCVDALELATDFAEKEGVELIPGIELTAEKDDNEVHILGYYIDWKNKILLKAIEEMQKIRIERIYDMIEKLKKVNVYIKPEEVFQISGKGSVGRLHLAYAIYNSGYTKYVKEAFKLYIGDGKSCYVNKFNFSPNEVIDIVLKSGGIPVLAHPGVMGRDEFISEYAEGGLRGIEVYHSDHSPKASEHYLEIAKKMNLLVTGGSDCHGLGKQNVLMWTVTIDYSLVEELKKAAGRL